MSIDLTVERFYNDVQKQIEVLNDTWAGIVGQDKRKGDTLRCAITSVIPDAERLWSARTGYDVGTPLTVDVMIEKRDFGKDWGPPMWQSQWQDVLDHVGGNTKPLRDMLIVAYLTGFESTFSVLTPDKPDVPVFSGRTDERPIYDELVAWMARSNSAEWKILPRVIAMKSRHRATNEVPYALANYCAQNQLNRFYAMLYASLMELPFRDIRGQLETTQKESLEAVAAKPLGTAYT